MKPLVSIFCLTYNHVNYISACIEGFLMQKTTFEYEILIHDDASTDGTRAVIEEYQQKYPTLIKPLFQTENQYSKGVRGIMIKSNFTRCNAKYIALCDGDDYWTDELKLQRQVNFLETNPDFSICWTNYLELNEVKSTDLKKPDWNSQIDVTQNQYFNLENIFTPYCTLTLSTLFRKSAFNMPLLLSLSYVKDNTYYAICLMKGKGILLNCTSAVYRIHSGGIYSGASQYKQLYFSYLNIKEIVEKIPNCNNQNLRNIRNSLLSQSIKHYPNQLSKDYFKLLLSSYKFLGIKQTAKIIRRKYLDETAKG